MTKHRLTVEIRTHVIEGHPVHARRYDSWRAACSDCDWTSSGFFENETGIVPAVPKKLIKELAKFHPEDGR